MAGSHPRGHWAALCLVAALLAPAWARAGTYFVDGACASSGAGTTLACGSSGPFRTISEGLAALAADARSGQGGTLNVRGAHGSFDGVYEEYVGIWGSSALDCTEANPCVMQGCPASVCGQDETPILSGLVRRTDWTESGSGSGVWFRQMEAVSQYVYESSALTDSYDPGYIVQGAAADATREFLQYSTSGSSPGEGRWYYDASTHRVYVNPRGSGNPNTGGDVWIPSLPAVLVVQGVPGRCPAPDCPSFNNVTLRRLRIEGGRSTIVEINTGYEGSGHNVVLDELRLAYGTRYGLFGQKFTNLTVDDVVIEHMGRGMSTGNQGSFPLRLFQIRGGTLRGVTTRHGGSAGYAGGCGAQGQARPFIRSPWDSVEDNPVCGMGISKILQSQNVVIDGFSCTDMSLGCLNLDNVSNSILENCDISNTYNGISMTDWTAAPSGTDSLSKNNIIRNCRIDNAGWNDYGAINVEPTDDSLGSGDFLVKIYGNMITRSSRAGIVFSRYQTPQTTLRRVSIWNNTIWQDRAPLGYPCSGWCPWNTAASGIDFDKNQLSSVTEVDVRNNLFKDLSQAGVTMGPSPAAAVVLDNNLYHNTEGEWSGTGSCPSWVGTAVRWQTSCYASPADFHAATGQEGSAVAANPLLVNAAGGDLRLCLGAGAPASGCTAVSPAIDRGVPVGLPYGGAAPDLGALETSTGSAQPPPAPTLIEVVPLG